MTRTNKAAKCGDNWTSVTGAAAIPTTNKFHDVIIILRDVVLVQNSTIVFTQLNPHPSGKYYILRSYTFRYRFHVDLRHPGSWHFDRFSRLISNVSDLPGFGSSP
ncbi:hypothetical protein T01_2947 [Trichinella spiralis]|uniref:Uncharacterized protein n=1 Tax=Trichinella spiralis TaxID=6334 RepID=A0A0V1BNF2_TRISP|nr:hypothetical protein T01_2947 [Trichinella spiralis]